MFVYQRVLASDPDTDVIWDLVASSHLLIVAPLMHLLRFGAAFWLYWGSWCTDTLAGGSWSLWKALTLIRNNVVKPLMNKSSKIDHHLYGCYKPSLVMVGLWMLALASPWIRCIWVAARYPLWSAIATWIPRLLWDGTMQFAHQLKPPTIPLFTSDIRLCLEIGFPKIPWLIIISIWFTYRCQAG